MLVVLLGLPCSLVLAQPGEPGYGANPTEDRELIVRFARTYGMMQAALSTADVADDEAEDLESLQEPVRSRAFTILDTNGIELETWQAFLERLEHDDQLRQRIESLAAPYLVQ
jgi:hypothetical protein